MKCQDVMTDNPVCCLPEDNVGQAARLMRRERIGSVPIVTDELKKELIGIVTDRDLAIICLKCLEKDPSTRCDSHQRL